jgi:hypothetical protein
MRKNTEVLQNADKEPSFYFFVKMPPIPFPIDSMASIPFTRGPEERSSLFS